MSIVTLILGFLSQIITGVLTDALRTPAITTTVEEAPAPIDLPATSTDELLAQYIGLLDRD